MKALADLPRAGFPPDYLFARIRGRRRELLAERVPGTEGRAAAGDSEVTALRRLQRETGWLYRQMNRRLRTLFTPILVELELHTALLCLRLLESAPQQVERLLANSLLTPSLQSALRQPGGRLQAAAALADAIAPSATEARRLSELLAQEGLAAFERSISSTFLMKALQDCRPPVLRRFLQRLVDLRNLRDLGKHLRWELTEPPSFLPGGILPRSALESAWRRRALAPLLPAAASPVATVLEAEAALLQVVTAETSRAARQPDGTGLILDYLWRLRLRARNQRLLLYGRELPAEVLARELQ